MAMEFTGSVPQLREMYEGGHGISQIMTETGLDYERTMTKLKAGGVRLITGGPHDTDACQHDHTLAVAHRNGARCCRARGSR